MTHKVGAGFEFGADPGADFERANGTPIVGALRHASEVLQSPQKAKKKRGGK